jgi:hypothetical protein
VRSLMLRLAGLTMMCCAAQMYLANQAVLSLFSTGRTTGEPPASSVVVIAPGSSPDSRLLTLWLCAQALCSRLARASRTLYQCTKVRVVNQHNPAAVESQPSTDLSAVLARVQGLRCRMRCCGCPWPVATSQRYACCTACV